MKTQHTKVFKNYFWDKRTNQLVAEELIADKVLDHVDCFTYIGNVLVPLDSQRFLILKGEDPKYEAIVDACRVVLKIAKVA